MNDSTWPTDFFDFAFVLDVDERLRDLSELAEDEDWSYHHTESDHPFPILFNYIRYTYRRLAEELKIALSDDGQYCCFNTGLVTNNQEPLRVGADVASPRVRNGVHLRGLRARVRASR